MADKDEVEPTEESSAARPADARDEPPPVPEAECATRSATSRAHDER